MRSTSIRNDEGFTLIEVALALFLFSALLFFSSGYIGNAVNEARFQETVRRLKLARRGLVGDPFLRRGGTRSEFGFHGDIGALPNAAQGLAALRTNPGLPTWATNNAARTALGWSANYVPPEESGESTLQDAWGTNLVYNPVATPPTITSYGADLAAGGSALNADLVAQIPDSARLATVHGVILSNGAQWSGTAQAEIFYPDGTGNLTSTLVSIATADKGHFVFPNIPQGARSATVYVPSKAAATKTIGPVAFVVDRPYYLIPVNFFDLGTTTGPTNLEVPIEMVDLGLSSSIINLFSSFERTRTPLNTADYDGTVTYIWEVVATNTALLPTVLSLVNSAGASVATVTVPGLTNAPVRISTAFTPTNGANDYRIQIPLTVLLNQVTVTNARLLVRQVNATKTKVYVPLLDESSTGFTNLDTAAADTTTSTTFTQNAPLEYGIWKKDLSRLSLATSTTTPYTFFAVIQGGNLGATATAALFNRTTGTAVTGAQVTRAVGTFASVSASFGDAAANFTDLNEFEVRLKSSSALQAVGIARAGLFIKLENLGVGEAYYRVSRNYSGTAGLTADGQRALPDPARYSNAKFYAEAVGYGSVAASTSFQVLDAGATEQGTAGTAYPGTSLALPAAKTRLRSSAFSPVTGDRTLGQVVGNGAATANFTSGAVLVQFSH